MKSNDANCDRTGEWMPGFDGLGGSIHQGVVQDWGHARVVVWARELVVKFVPGIEETIEIRVISPSSVSMTRSIATGSNP